MKTKTTYYVFCGFPSHSPVCFPSVRVSKSEFEYALRCVTERFPDAIFEWRVLDLDFSCDVGLYINNDLFAVRKKREMKRG